MCIRTEAGVEQYNRIQKKVRRVEEWVGELCSTQKKKNRTQIIDRPTNLTGRNRQTCRHLLAHTKYRQDAPNATWSRANMSCIW